ncbi:extracellular solute-binding protein [Bifidobacterium vespertilionis]|uniref:Extracellular solute-binding protein n=1 Tax=Bifidobacterium vespertilionis TaxID=2562524 RepID=A0A5J5DT08_9BIFI|nr:extracellular solute-binding protein [Bifidobacterium vespertilionis]KAA8818049.1 extracellular solute-binding protein [Bifidobacterium vespertilionis]KAA8822299.1 extracellular solute-binding protein [Bifidobacterium vespertilionis]
MKAFNKIMAGVASLAMLVGVSACGSSGGSGDTASNTASGGTQDVTLTVWAPQEDQTDSNSWLPKMEEAFKQAHPEYNITFKNSVVSEADAGTTVKQDPSAAADVYLFASDQLGTLIDAKAIGQLSDDGLAQVKQQNSDVMIQSVTGEDGEVYGVPFTGNTWFMYYNKSKFTEQDVKSLDTMLEKGKVSYLIGDSWHLPAFYMGDSGASLFGKDSLTASDGLKLGSHAAGITKYLVNMSKNPNYVNGAEGAGLAGMQNGTVDALFSGSWDAAKVKEALGDNYGVAVPPTFTVDGQQLQLTPFAGSKAVGYNPNTDHYEVAAMFAAYLGSTEAQKAHYDMRQIIPSDKSLASDSAIAADPMAKAQIDTVNNASVVQPVISQMADFWKPAESFGKGILNGEVTVDNAAEKTEAWASGYNFK